MLQYRDGNEHRRMWARTNEQGRVWLITTKSQTDSINESSVVELGNEIMIESSDGNDGIRKFPTIQEKNEERNENNASMFKSLPCI